MDPLIVAESPNNTVFTFTAAVYAAFLLWETVAPRRELSGGMAWRWLNNFSLSALTWYSSALAGTWFMVWVAGYLRPAEFGLLPQIGAGPVLSFILLLASTQLLSYLFHIAFHHVSWLWPIHAVHHSDIDVDVSTSYRHHPLEPLVSLPVAGPLVYMLGVPVDVILYYRLFEVAATVFSHSNVYLPGSLEKYLRWVILTPDFHRTHHCSDPQYTNSNYGSLVPWFDYLFGTAKLRPDKDQESMELGLEYLRSGRDAALDRLLLTPVRAELRGTASQERSRPE